MISTKQLALSKKTNGHILKTNKIAIHVQIQSVHVLSHTVYFDPGVIFSSSLSCLHIALLQLQ